MSDVERTGGWQRWQNLLFLHWPVTAGALRPLVPRSLELDAHDGVYYVGLVPFQMLGIRTAWMPKALSFDFLETNVRTYVRHGGRQGVYFFSLEASSKLAVRVARAQWGLPYYDAQMSFHREGERVRYQSKRSRAEKGHLDVDYTIGQRLADSVPGTLQHFLLERYHLFLEKREQLWSGRVEHTPYPACHAQVHSLDESLIAAAGITRPQTPPLAHYASAVDVRVCSLRKV
ncbi:MAG: DUF2071 domain-containing protein [Sandaracinaceae bacterium]|nr:DUF2071 domain-containing protein [Sandaracinaceae bacterium]